MNKIYYKSPVIFQHLLTSMYGYKLKRERYNKTYKLALKSYVNENKKSDKLLLDLLIYLKKNILYYNEINIDERNILQSFKLLNFTEKDDLRKELKNRSNITNDVRTVKTGGTTGKSLKVYLSELDRAKRMAYLDYIKLLSGVEPFSKRASFTGKEIVPKNYKNKLWRYNIPMNQILYASFKMNNENVKYIFENLKKRKPVTIDGFPSAIHLLAKYILLNNIKVNWDIKAIFPTAETLTTHIKNDIEKAFNTTVIDQYASSEGAPFIYSDAQGHYHLGNETGLFEFYKNSNNIYDMVVTSFINEATPIIRYKIGDQVEISSDKEYLNSLTDEIKIIKILGRNTDYLIGDNNNKVTSVNLANAIKELGIKIIQSQFIQKNKNTYEINLVVSKDYQKIRDEDILIEKLNHRLGVKNNYKFNYLSEVPKEKSGKTRFIINEMGETK